MVDTAAAAAAEAPFDDPALEQAYQAARPLFVAPKATSAASAWLLGSLAIFAALELAEHGSITKLVLLVAVLLFHELGHYLGMVALGYRDVRMFFIPFVGAAVSGRRGSGSQTREAIVLLLGPVPGIAFGVSAAAAAAMLHSTMLKTVAEYLLAINLLNLLPIIPLDGGRLASALLFSRWRRAEGLFVGGTLATALVLCLVAQAWVFAFVSFFLLMTLPVQLRMSRVAADVRAEGLPLTNDPAALDAAPARAIFHGVARVMPKATPKAAADWMTQVLEIACRRPPSIGRTLALSAVWATAFVVGALALGIAGSVK